MTWLTAEDIACIQESVLSIMSGTAIIHARTETHVGGGNYTETYAASGTVPCRVDAGREPMEIVIAEKVTSVVPFSIIVPVGTTVTAKDRIIVGAATYEVIGNDAGRTDSLYLLNTCRRVD